MRRLRVLLIAWAIAAALFAVANPAVAEQASRIGAVPAGAARTCGNGYTHAVIGGAEKCLRAGEFCTHAYDSQYRRYGFRCIRYYANVHRYRLTYA